MFSGANFGAPRCPNTNKPRCFMVKSTSVAKAMLVVARLQPAAFEYTVAASGRSGFGKACDQMGIATNTAGAAPGSAPEKQEARQPQHRAWFTPARGVLGLLLLAGLVYANCLGGGFLLDDEKIYIEDPGLPHLTVLAAFGRMPLQAMPHRQGFFYYRPITVLAHSLLLRFFGAQPFPLHLFSVVLHAAAAVFVFLLLALLVDSVSAWLAAALFLVHPLHVECVAWMSGLPELLAGVFSLLSLYAVVRARSVRPFPDRGLFTLLRVPFSSPLWLSISCLAAAAAALSKETAIVLPVLAVALAGWAAWPLFAVAGGAMALRYLMMGTATAYLPPRPFWSQLYLMASALIHYARKTVWPWPLASEYNLRQPAAVWVLAVVVAALLALLAVRRPRVRLGLALFLIPLAPAVAASLVLPGMRQAQDRYAYLAVLGFIYLLVIAARSHRARLALAAVIVIWGALSINNTRYWRDPESFWSQTLRVTPLSRNAVLGLGEWYYSTQRFADAERIYRYGLTHRPNDPDILASHESVLKALGKPSRKQTEARR